MTNRERLATNRWVTPLVLAVAMLSGCGGASSSSDQAKKVVVKFYAAVQARDGAKACDLLTANGQTALAATAAATLNQQLDCTTAVSRGGAANYLLPNAKIGEVTGGGPALTVTVRGANGDSERVLVVNDAGHWRISGF